jgi:hypothetical protein
MCSPDGVILAMPVGADFTPVFVFSAKELKHNSEASSTALSFQNRYL